MFTILAHPAYTNKKFKPHNQIPHQFRATLYAPEILTPDLTFALMPSPHWAGSLIEAQRLIPHCIELGKNPMIVAEVAIVAAPTRKPASEPVVIPRDQTWHLYTEILKIIGFCPQYNELFIKLSEHNVALKGKVRLNDQELNQLFTLLKIEHEFTTPVTTQTVLNPFRLPIGMSQYENEPKTPLIDLSEYTATDDDIRPKNVPLFDLSEFDEEEPETITPVPKPTESEPTEPEFIPQIDTTSPEFLALHAETERLYQEFMENAPVKEISYKNADYSVLVPYKERNIEKKSHKRKKR